MKRILFFVFIKLSLINKIGAKLEYKTIKCNQIYFASRSIINKLIYPISHYI